MAYITARQKTYVLSSVAQAAQNVNQQTQYSYIIQQRIQELRIFFLGRICDIEYLHKIRNKESTIKEIQLYTKFCHSIKTYPQKILTTLELIFLINITARLLPAKSQVVGQFKNFNFDMTSYKLQVSWLPVIQTVKYRNKTPTVFMFVY